MRIFILLFTLSIFSLHAQELRKISLQLLWKHQFEFAGYYMAKEKGFYKDAGLDVEIKEYEYGLNINQEVVDGKSDFGINDSSLILDKMNGLDIYLMMATFQKSPFVLMSLKRDDLMSVSDLKGKKIMVTPNQAAMSSLNAMLRTNNIFDKDYIAQQHSFNINDLIDGKTDAMCSYVSNEPFYLIEKGIEYTIFNPAENGFNFYDNILFTSKQLALSDPELVDKFYEASLKGWEYAYSHVEESARVILKEYNSQNKSLSHLIYEANTMKELSALGSVEYGKFKKEIIMQIAQTYKLLDITKGTINLDGLIYPKAILQDSYIDYQLVWKILVVVALILIGFYYWNRKLSLLNTQIEISKKKIMSLLDNAGQGFLSFNTNFIVDNEYSKECLKYLGEDIAYRDITDLLFVENGKKEFFKSTLLGALDVKTAIAQNAILSLLPNFIVLNKRALRLEYKVIDHEKIMLIITNISEQKKLEKKIKKEQEMLKMIVGVVSQSETFYDIKNDFTNFIHSYESMIDYNRSAQFNTNVLYRLIHTFKGIFSQLYMNEIVTYLHEVESRLSILQKEEYQSNEKLTRLLKECDFESALDRDLNVIKEILGDDFLDVHNFLKIDYYDIQNLQEKISKVLESGEHTTPECQDILCHIQNLSSQKLMSLLKPYENFTQELAKRLNKEISPLEIKGDHTLFVGEKFKPFVKSLIHVFRNSIDHGIEDAESRVLKGKEEMGMIECHFTKDDNAIELVISDDGAGIDLQKIKERLERKGIQTQSLSEEALFEYIFDDGFSTKESISDISGRGVGLSALKNELLKLGGRVEISSKKDVGTTFKFIIPHIMDTKI